MSIYVCKRSAYLLLSKMWEREIVSLPRSGSFKKCTCLASSITETALSLLGREDIALDLLLPDAAWRQKQRGIKWHVWSGPLRKGSFLELDENAFVSSPEFLFLQFAPELSFVGLVELGMELCGTYAFSDYEPGFIQRTAPIATPKSIGRFLDRSKGSYGSRHARNALKWVVGGSASPAETKAFMKLTLSRYHEGFACPAPVLNYRLELPARYSSMIGKAYLVLDMFFPGSKVAIEYDSNKYHVGADRISSDARRRNLLEHMGIKVITLTSDQLNDPWKFESFAQQVLKALGKRFRAPESQLRARDINLYKELGLSS